VPTLHSDPLKVDVFSFGAPVGGTVWNKELRLIRASVLYGDVLNALEIPALIEVAAAKPVSTWYPSQASVSANPRGARAWFIARVAAGLDGAVPLKDEAAREAEAQGRELRQLVRAGLFAPTGTYLFSDPKAVIVMGGTEEVEVLRNLSLRRGHDFDSESRAAMLHGVLATSLIGELEAFPDAEMDVVLDVRDRIADSRAYFRGAISELTRELSAATDLEADLSPLLADLRRRVIDPALQRIRDDLTDLGVRRTLLRLASDRLAATSVGSALAMAAGLGGSAALHALLSGAIGAPLLAAAAREAQHRVSVSDEVRARPYWFLHEADHLLRAQL
jgi:hypothetical protein